MKKLVTLALAMLIATSALAITNTDPDIMGFYFDVEADFPCVENVTPYSQIPMYLILTNPTFDALYGFEVGYDLEGTGMVLETVFANPSIIDVGEPGNHIVGFGSPTLAMSATLLATLNVMYMDTSMDPLLFHMHGTTPSSIDPMYPVVLLDGGVLQLVGINVYYNPDIASGINLICYSATDNVSFDGIKSLYR